MKFILLTILFILNNTTVFSQQKIYSIVDYGAVGDGIANSAAPIQKAIDEAAKNNGGVVLVPKGIFVTGSIELKSGVELHLEDGAILQGSNERRDYDAFNHPSLIIAIRQHHIAITGNGMIDGKGRELMKDIFKMLEEGTLISKDWKTKRPGENTRTSLLYLEDCTDIKITGIFFKDATSWVTHYQRCKNLLIDHIRLESMAYWNNDGLDIVDCKNVKITNSSINSADDAICLKSDKLNDFCDSIFIDNCLLRSSANAFKLGTGSRGGFKNIRVSNLKVYDTYRSAIALETVDGGFLENIDIRHVTAKNTGNAIFIKSGHRNNDDVFSSIKNVHIDDVSVEIPKGKPDEGYEMEGPLLKYPKGFVPDSNKLISISPWNHSTVDSTAIIYKHNLFPSSISGLPGHPVQNVVLENINIVYMGKADKAINYFPLDSIHLITEAEKDYPEFSMFGELPVWGFYVRHVEGIVMKNIKLLSTEKDFRSAMIFDDVDSLKLNKVEILSGKKSPAILLNNVKVASLEKMKLPFDRSKSILVKQTKIANAVK